MQGLLSRRAPSGSGAPESGMLMEAGLRAMEPQVGTVERGTCLLDIVSR